MATLRLRYKPSPRVASGLEQARVDLVPVSETLKGAWSVISINQWDKEQERFVLLTDLAYYRVKYDYDQRRVDHYERVALSDISFIQQGFLYRDKYSLSTLVEGRGGSADPDAVCAARVFCGYERTPNPFNQKQYYRTYSILGNNKEDTKALVMEMVECFAKARKAVTQGTFYISENDIHRPAMVSVVSLLHNKLRLGMSKG
eukprot:GFYU01021133.1.p1 GENE.GFYU01021133.1~~GFYU01021133.1.p1  ORF type:complete len:202 (+),score=39.97 GFYU01021133.1:75-680(+)